MKVDTDFVMSINGEAVTTVVQAPGVAANAIYTDHAREIFNGARN
mgnify:CR=1 FL=1